MINSCALTKLRIINAIVVLTLVSTAPADASISVLTRSQQTHPDWQFGYRITSFEDGRLLYTICDNKDNEKTCMIVQEELLSGTTTYSCNVTLKPEQNNARPGKFFARSFGQDRAIFVWEEKGEESFIKFITIKLTSCESNEAKLVDNSKMQRIEPIAYQLYTSLKIATYEDYYDVFFKDIKRCGKRECKISIDAEGYIMDEPTSFISINRYQMVIVLQPIAERATDKGFVCVKFNWDRTYLSFVRLDGKEKSLARIDNDNQITGVIVEHEIVGVCMISEREFKVTCSQYDSDGNVKLESVITGVSPQTHMMSAHILHQGGFLLMFCQTEKCSEPDGCIAVTNYLITRVDETGKVVGQFQLKGFVPTGIFQHIGFIYENPDAEGHCATVVYSKYDQTGNNEKKKANNRHVITNCFTEADDSSN